MRMDQFFFFAFCSRIFVVFSPWADIEVLHLLTDFLHHCATYNILGGRLCTSTRFIPNLKLYIQMYIIIHLFGAFLHLFLMSYAISMLFSFWQKSYSRGKKTRLKKEIK